MPGTKTVKVKDKGMIRAIASQIALNRWQATIGIHGKADYRPDEMDNIGLGVIHEFGVTINHPGGTDYMVDWTGGGRSGGLVGGAITFLPRGDKRSIGKTKPHVIKIPERSFLRSSFDKNRRKYERIIAKQVGLAIDGKQKPERVIGIVGERAHADVINRINRGIPPPNKPSTIRRKGSSKPLVDTGALKQSIQVVVRKGRQ